MPYIPQERRIIMDESTDVPKNAGELNYVITGCILDYLDELKQWSYRTERHENVYEDYNEVIGVLECVKQEFYRRKVSPYEEIKMKINGDVY